MLEISEIPHDHGTVGIMIRDNADVGRRIKRRVPGSAGGTTEKKETDLLHSA